MSGTSRRFLVRIDGACSGNPGPAAAAVVIRAEDDGTVVHEQGYYLGRATNNIAEYYGLLIALEELLVLRADEAVVESDSELLVRQMSGEYRVKAPGLRFVHERVKRLSSTLRKFELRHIPRERNKEADGLARKAIKRGAGGMPNDE
jgi:ribonuclease HI